MKTTVLGVPIDALTLNEAADRAQSWLSNDTPRAVYTPNPEILMLARKDANFADALRRGDMIVPDGIGVVYASRLNKIKLTGRVPGYDLTLALFERMRLTNKTAYFFGAKPGVAAKAAAETQRRFPGLRVVGTADGYFDAAREKLIIEEIQTLKPDLLLVGLGAPKQELWIDAHKHALPCKLCIGVGGSFDGFSGNIPRAPEIWRTLNLEWLYRLVKQPSRITRMGALPAFMLAVLKDKVKR